MRKKEPISFSQKFPNADLLALDLLQRLLAFDPKDRPTAEEVAKFIHCNLFLIHYCHRLRYIHLIVGQTIMFIL
jgi:serine/threonine protein kinase